MCDQASLCSCHVIFASRISIDDVARRDALDSSLVQRLAVMLEAITIACRGFSLSFLFLIYCCNSSKALTSHAPLALDVCLHLTELTDFWLLS